MLASQVTRRIKPKIITNRKKRGHNSETKRANIAKTPKAIRNRKTINRNASESK